MSDAAGRDRRGGREAEHLDRAIDREVFLRLVTDPESGEAIGGLLAAVRGSALDDPDMRLRELTEIERMRDLEIARLEAELAEKTDVVFDLETALFHASRRGDDLDRRWNELAEEYEQVAERLVEAGGRLEAIEGQASYRATLAVTGILRRQPAVYSGVRRFARRVFTRSTP
ncbi:MAG TPA: hypothetical protein VNF07_00030 [Acidimicrobiales bacterium]|nr:hypothetical protein [Acidimicrobiales bacterium]